MKIGDLAELATQNLREAVLRNSLTTLGIAVGVASLVAMLSLGIGLQEMISRRLERNGLFDTVLARPSTAHTATGQIRRNRGVRADRGRARADSREQAERHPEAGGRDPVGSDIVSRPLHLEARRPLAQLPHGLEVYPEFRFTGDFRF